VSDYGLDDRAIGVRSPAEARDFSCSLCVQTGSEAHPASCTMGTGGPFPGVKARPGRDADRSPPSSAEVVNEYELYLSLQAPPWRVAGLLYFYIQTTRASQTTASVPPEGALHSFGTSAIVTHSYIGQVSVLGLQAEFFALNGVHQVDVSVPSPCRPQLVLSRRPR
jgi:hypothetical protein